jgi:hypothetical protein
MRAGEHDPEKWKPVFGNNEIGEDGIPATLRDWLVAIRED